MSQNMENQNMKSKDMEMEVKIKYVIQDLTIEQVSDIYKKWIHLHFPQDEIKPLKNIQKMWEIGAYRALGMYEQKGEKLDFIGYAFLAMAPDCSMLLLDYLAIVEAYRGQGIGSIFLHEMQKRLQEFDGILIETEDVNFAYNKEELQARKKRNCFYEKNRAVRTIIKSEIYGVHYAIWNLPVSKPIDNEICKTNLENIYKIMIPGEKNEKFVKIEMQKI